MGLLSGIPYIAPPSEGFWGAPTATIDWCEENYVVSHYIAEFVNTLTNAAFIMLAGFALRNAMRDGHEFRFVLASMGFILVGVGSWMFHMTLRYEFQLLDELPMIYATCIPCWSVFSFGTSKQKSRVIGFSILFGAALLTAVYLHVKNPTLHQAAYGALNVAIIVESVRQTRRHVKDTNALRNFNWLLFLGIAEFLSGWAIWNADIHFCSTWIWLRRIVGMPYGFLLEGHGWWHLLTGSGVYCYLVYLEYLRLWLTGRQDDYVYTWKWHMLPVIKPKSAVYKSKSL